MGKTNSEKKTRRKREIKKELNKEGEGYFKKRGEKKVGDMKRTNFETTESKTTSTRSKRNMAVARTGRCHKQDRKRKEKEQGRAHSPLVEYGKGKRRGIANPEEDYQRRGLCDEKKGKWMERQTIQDRMDP